MTQEKNYPISEGPRVRPPQRKRYSFKLHGKPITATFGQLLFKPSANVTVVRPRWTGTLPLTIKILPARSYDDTSRFDDYRNSEDVDDFTDWVRALYIADYVGQEGKEVSIALFDPRDTEEGYSVYENPYYILYRAFKQALKEGAAYIGQRNVMTTFWARLDAENRVSKPKHIYVVQAVVYANNDKVYVQGGKPPLGAGPEDRLHIAVIGESAWRSISKALNEQHEEPIPDREGWEAVFKYGDITRLDGGKFVTIYRPSTHGVDLARITSNKMTSEVISDELSEMEESSGDDSRGESYLAVLHDEFYYTSKGQRRKRTPSLANYLPQVASRIAYWDDILYFPTHEEIALTIARAFSSFPELLYYAWKDFPEFLTAEVKGVLANRTQVPVTTEPPVSGSEDEVVVDEEAPPAKVTPQFRAKVSEALRGLGGALDTDEFDHLGEGDDEAEQEAFAEENGESEEIAPPPPKPVSKKIKFRK
jgi:hypothetical protein